MVAFPFRSNFLFDAACYIRLVHMLEVDPWNLLDVA